VYRNEKLSLQSYQDVIAPHAVQCVEKARFSDRHFWHAGYDKAFSAWESLLRSTSVLTPTLNQVARTTSSPISSADQRAG